MGAFHYAIISVMTRLETLATQAIISENVQWWSKYKWKFVQEEICSNIGQPPISVPLALARWSV